jgi:hypothetical protein
MKEATKLPTICISSYNDRHPLPKTFTPLHYTLSVVLFGYEIGSLATLFRLKA